MRPALVSAAVVLARLCSRSDEGRIEGLAGEDRLEGGQERLALLAQRREIPAQARERISSCLAAEAARDFLLHLEPAQVAFRLVIVEGDGEVVEEGQHLLLAEGEALEQVARRRLGEPAALTRSTRRRGRRVGSQPDSEHVLVPGAQPGMLSRWHRDRKSTRLNSSHPSISYA